MGVMSEICARGKILVARLKGDGVPLSDADAERMMADLEREMTECSAEFERLVPR